ncbi:MAG: HvfC/BufC family peptide modification chaperone [Gammaproteobacteria bacterium]
MFNNFTATSRTAYPAVLKLVGEEFFDGASARYIREYP